MSAAPPPEPLFVGVDVGGTKIVAGAVRGDQVSGTFEHPTDTSSEATVIGGIESAAREAIEAFGAPAAVGVGVPSQIEHATGRVLSSVNIPLEGEPLRDDMARRLGVTVLIDNDANCAALAEAHAVGVRNLIMLTLGTGVGGGLILDGRPYRGAVGAAAELGHIVVEFDGRPCQGLCRGRGHIETYATGVAATRDAAEALGKGADSHVLIERAKAKDAVALEVLDGIARRLGATMGSLVNIFNPEVIVVGGGWGKAADEYLLGTARDEMMREALSPGRELVRIVPAELGSDAGLVGAGFVAFEALDAG